MRNFFVKYPLLPFILLGLLLNSYLVLNEGYKYCQIEYCGTVVSKNISSGKCSTYFLLVDFGERVGTQELNVAPTTHASYSTGDRYCLKSDFNILYGRGGTAYHPEDPQFKILNNLVLVITHAVSVVILTIALLIYLIWLMFKFNSIISKALTKRIIKNANNIR